MATAAIFPIWMSLLENSTAMEMIESIQLKPIRKEGFLGHDFDINVKGNTMQSFLDSRKNGIEEIQDTYPRVSEALAVISSMRMDIDKEWMVSRATVIIKLIIVCLFLRKMIIINEKKIKELTNENIPHHYMILLDYVLSLKKEYAEMENKSLELCSKYSKVSGIFTTS